MDFFGILTGLITGLLIPGVIIALIIVGIRRAGDGQDDEPGIGTVRRVFFYGLAFVALMLAATGVTLLLWQVLETLFGGAILRDDAFRISVGLASTIVGLPIWLLLWRAAERSLEQYPSERGKMGRKAYFYGVLFVAAAVTAGFLIEVVQGILSPSTFSVGTLAPVIAWSAVWLLHWVWERAEGQPTPIARSVRRVYAYLTSTYALVLLSIGVGQVLAQLLGSAYDALFAGAVVGDGGVRPVWNVPVRDALALAIVGAAWWWFHWHAVSRGDVRSVLRQVIVYLVGIFGGLVTMVSALAAILQAVFGWALGAAEGTPAIWHFDIVPGALSAAIVGAAFWRYHSAVVVEEGAAAQEARLGALRTYRYLTAAVGLGTLAAGMATLFGIVIAFLIPEARGGITGSAWWAGPVSIALTLIIVGAPIWWFFWSQQQTAALTGPAEERLALSRRIFIFGVFGIAVLATLASLSTFLALVLEPLFEGGFDAGSLDAGKWALGVVLAAGAISIYYWQVLKEDREAAQRLAPEAPATAAPVVAEVTALAPAAARSFVDAIAASLGVAVRFWQRQDDVPAPALDDEQVQAIAAEVREAPAARVLLVIDASGVHVVPFSPT